MIWLILAAPLAYIALLYVGSPLGFSQHTDPVGTVKLNGFSSDGKANFYVTEPGGKFTELGRFSTSHENKTVTYKGQERQLAFTSNWVLV